MNITCVAADERDHIREGDKKDNYYIRAARERREEVERGNRSRKREELD